MSKVQIWEVLFGKLNWFLWIAHEKYCRSKFFNDKLNIKDALMCEQ